MWKSASRTLKSKFNRGVLRCSTVLSTEALQKKELHGLLKFTPFLLQHCNRFYNFYKGTENFTNDNKKEGPKEKKASFLESFDNDFVDALKWSGIFALGYFTILQYKLKVSFPQELYEDRTSCYHKTLGHLVNITGIRPYSCVLPEVHAAKSSKSRQQVTDSAAKNLKPAEKDFNTLEKAHKKVLGAVRNFLGIQCMQSGHHKEAFEYFLQSADEEHAPGIFNLGICHEKGLGTNQNLQKAAELYQRAADLGHATAMYNLGVFYAQGRGTIQTDVDHARKLFRAAASLGQMDAIKALNLEKQAAQDMPQNTFISDVSGKGENTQSNALSNRILGQSLSNSFIEFSDCDSDEKSHFHFFEKPLKGRESNLSLDSDSGALDLSPQNEPYSVLV